MLPTGLARVVRSIFEPIHAKGDFQVIQHGWYHLAQGSLPVPWKIVPVKRHPQDPKAFDPADKMGEQSFTPLVDSLKPDIVFSVTDYDRMGHLAESPSRSSYAWVAYLPLDTFPPTKKWQDITRFPDQTVYYTEWAKSWGDACESPGKYIPHGIDPELFKPTDSKERSFMREKFFKCGDDNIIITMSGRNLARKRLDLGIEAVSHLIHGAYGRCTNCRGVCLLDYNLPAREFKTPDVNFECPRCFHKGMPKVGRPYPELRLNIHTDLKEDSRIPLYEIAAFWQITNHMYLNSSLQMSRGIGVPEDQMSQVYQCSDIFLHTANGGGWELPPMEGAASGLPVVAVDAPAQNEWLRTLPGSTLVPGTFQWDSSCSGYRAYATAADVVQGLLVYLQDPENSCKAGHSNAEFCRENYSWESIVPQWEEIFHSMISGESRVHGWRVLQEV
jgi:glycosyltransferase involved in cell wall biosynthesis